MLRTAERGEELADVRSVDTPGSAVSTSMEPEPIAGISTVLRGLRQINRWLTSVDCSELHADLIESVVVGLGHIDAATTTAKARAIVAADENGLAERDGATSDVAWIADKLRLTGATAARESRFAHDLLSQPDLLSQLEAGRVSREHATGVVAALAQQQRDNDHAEHARRQQLEEERRAREAAAERAAAKAQDAAEAEALRRAARDRERQLAEQAAREEAARDAAADQAIADRAAELTDLAAGGHSPDDVRRTGRERRAEDAEALARTEREQFSRRSVRHWIDRVTGMGTLHASLPVEAYEQVLAALRAATHFDSPTTPASECRTTEQRQADAFIDVVGASLRAGDLGTTQGVKPHLTLHASIETVTGEEDRAATTTYGHKLSPETLRRIACDAGLTRAILNATGQVLDVGRETRQWSVAQYRAAALAFGGCAFPVSDQEACGRPMGWTDMHHVTYWRRGGHTDLANGIPLCRRHHTITHRPDHDLTYDHATLTVSLTRHGRGRPTTRHVTFATPRQPERQPARVGNEHPPGAATIDRRHADGSRRAGSDRRAAVRERLPI